MSKHWFYALSTLTMLLALVACSPTASLPAGATQTAIQSTPASPTTAPTPTVVSLPQSTVPSSVVFTLHPAPGDTILPPTDLPAFDAPYSDPGAVTYHDGQFQMFYNCQFGYPPSRTSVGYAYSSDGSTWTRVGEESLLDMADIPYDAHVILAGSVLVEADGTWVLYFHTRGQANGASQIGRATAPAPTGPWTFDASPALAPDAGAWDEGGVQRPTVVRTADGYFMYYVGLDTNNTGMIGLATSPDGVRWTKHDDPATTETPFALSDPVWTAAQTGWADVATLKYPRILVTPDGWVLFYHAASSSDGTHSRIGVAISSDGVTWRQLQEQPVLTAADQPGWNIVWVDSVVFVDDTYSMFVELVKGGVSYINVATYTGTLLGEGDAALPAQAVDRAGQPMILIPAGPFVMGSTAVPDATPHTVWLSDYYIDQYEVTNAQFVEFLNLFGNQTEGNVPWVDADSDEVRIHQVDGVWQPDPGFADHPMVEVTRYGAQAYCAWLGERLPTEAEWEKAARGTDERTFPWGEEISCDDTNYGACGLRQTVEVGRYPQSVSPYGIHDMAGNAAEWTTDWYDDDYYAASPLRNPTGPEDSPGDHVATRGGSWFSTDQFLRTFHRNHEFVPVTSFGNVGFRCAVSPQWDRQQ